MNLSRLIAAVSLILLAGACFWVWSHVNRSVSGPPLAAPIAKSVAVLPFVNMSPDKDNEYLSDGITEDLCTALTQIKGLHVPARTSSFAFKGKTEDIRKVGAQLNVGTVLEGSVSKAGNKLRITAQLINVADGFHLWAANYDREMTDILEIRSDISRQVVEALKVQLGIEETQRLARKPTQTSEAYETYLLGRYELNRFTEAGFNKGVQHFKRAIELDPSFALANAGLAEAYNLLAYWNYLSPAAGFPEAKRAAQRALELDPGLAEGHSELGFVLFEYEWQYEAGEREFVEAIRLNPRSATAHVSYGEFLLDLGRYPEAMREFDSTRQSDPLSVRLTFNVGAWYWFQRQLGPAVAEVQKAIAMDPANSLSYHMLGYIFLKMNRPAEAVDAWEKANTFEGVFTAEQNAELRKTYEKDGAPAFLRREAEIEQDWIRRGKYRSPLFIALHYAGAGANDQVLKWLEIAVQERAAWLPELKTEPTWDPLRSNPRFIALLKTVGVEK